MELIVSSGLGASEVSADGSEFSVELAQPLTIPREAQNVRLAVLGASVWWNTINIREDGVFNTFLLSCNTLNQQLPGTVPSTITPPTLHNVSLKAGQYSLSDISDAIVRFLIDNNVDPARAAEVLTLVPDGAAQRVVMTLTSTGPANGPWIPNTKNYGVSVAFTAGSFMAQLLGFNNLIAYSSPISGPAEARPVRTFRAIRDATINPVDYFVIHSDLVQRGVNFNGTYSQIIAQVPITSRSGEQIVFIPEVPPRSSAQYLAGLMIRKFRMWLTDAVGQPVPTNGRIWSARLALTYHLPFDLL